MAKDNLKQRVVELINRNRYSKLITFFATGLSTNKIKDIKKNPSVSVFVDDPNDQTNASIIGKAEIVTENRLRKKFWQEPFGYFFPRGPSDPDYCLLKITPKKVEYLNPGPRFHQSRMRTIINL
jgi:general stress protein 26